MSTRTRTHKTNIPGKFQTLAHDSTPPSLMLNNPKGENTIELRLIHPKSSIMQVTHNGKVFLGYSFYNPGIYDGDGVCVQQYAPGIDMSFLLHLFLGGSGIQELATRDTWKAWYRPLTATDTTRHLRLYFSNPFANSNPDIFFEQDVMFHQFMQ